MRPPLTLALAAALLACAGGAAMADGFADTVGRHRAPCHVDGAREIVLLTLGQSISANHGEAPYTPHGNVVNFNPNDWLCYAAMDPLLGATYGNNNRTGSIWGYLCDALLESRRWDRCIIAPIAQGSTYMRDWAPGGGEHHLIRETIGGMRASGLVPDVILYGQGEADAGIDADAAAYERSFNAMASSIRQHSNAPILVAVETTCDIGAAPNLAQVDDKTRVAKWIGQERIQTAQRAVINPAAKILPGPNLDFINDQAGRWDGCHLSSYGLRAAAAQWEHYVLDAIK